jgi:hypothetical protein
MADESPSYEELLRRIDTAPPTPDPSWLNETARLFYRYPFLADGAVLQNADGFPLAVLWFASSEREGARVSIEKALDSIVAGRLGLLILRPDNERIWELAHGQVLSWRIWDMPYPTRFWNAIDGTTWDVVETGERLLVSAPSDIVMPPLVRDCLRWVMKEKLKVSVPKIALVSLPNQPDVFRALFNLIPDELGGEEAALEAYKKLTWYLPERIPCLYSPGLACEAFLVPL